MSGITPILDTLLHQVLGRRDTPVDRPLPDNLIPPPRAGLPPQAAHSDSRLDPRPLPTAHTTIGGGNKVDAAPASRAAATATLDQVPAVTTRFSAAARLIADILARVPVAPAAIRASLPLLTTDERTQVAQLAARLRDSIESSGLFYEAHLLRWRGGTFPLAQLLREPQMLWSGRAGATPQAPLPPPQQGTASTASPPLLPNPSSAAPAKAVVAGNPPSPPIASPGYGADGKPVAGTHAESSAPGSLSSWALADGHQAVHPALEGVLRHQLEMLAAPVLRWEGAPWTGAFMALALQPPPLPPEQEESGSERRPREGAEVPWQTHLTLRLARLGEVAVNLQLGAQRVALELKAETAAADRMDAASGMLRERIEALGFQSVALRIHARETSDGP